MVEGSKTQKTVSIKHDTLGIKKKPPPTPPPTVTKRLLIGGHVVDGVFSILL